MTGCLHIWLPVQLVACVTVCSGRSSSFCLFALFALYIAVLGLKKYPTRPDSFMARLVTKNSFEALGGVCSHNAADYFVSFSFYNLGILDNELDGPRVKKNQKRTRIKNDIAAVFDGEIPIQALFVCEFGNMQTNYYGNTDQQARDAAQIFEEILDDLSMSHLVVRAIPPYIAIVDPNYWEVEDSYHCKNLCDVEYQFAMMLRLEHVRTGAKVAVANCHIPSKSGRSKCRTDTVTVLCEKLASMNNLSAWIIGGDCNLDQNSMRRACLRYLEPGVECISTSGADMSDARKADLAISRGLDLQQVDSWVGFHFGEHATDVHNMVPVIGVIDSYIRETGQPDAKVVPSLPVLSTALHSSDSLHFAGHVAATQVFSPGALAKDDISHASSSVSHSAAPGIPSVSHGGASVRPIKEDVSPVVAQIVIKNSVSASPPNVTPEYKSDQPDAGVVPSLTASAATTALSTALAVPAEPDTGADLKDLLEEVAPDVYFRPQPVLSTALHSSDSYHFAAHEAATQVLGPAAKVNNHISHVIPSVSHGAAPAIPSVSHGAAPGRPPNVTPSYKPDQSDAEVVPLLPVAAARTASSAAQAVPLQPDTDVANDFHAATATVRCPSGESVHEEEIQPVISNVLFSSDSLYSAAHEASGTVRRPAGEAVHEEEPLRRVHFAAPEAVSQVRAPIVIKNSVCSHGYSAAGMELFSILKVMAEDEDETAGDIVDTIISWPNSSAVKSPQQILSFFAEVSERRKACIEIVSKNRGVRHPARFGEYTQDQWRKWLEENPFDDDDMTANVKIWKKEFEANDLAQQKKVADWREEKTRASKAQANKLVNGAWKVHLADKYGPRGRQLAMSFLKCPSTNVYSLLDQWGKYLQSSDFQEERERSRQDRHGEATKHKEEVAKTKVYRLRHQVRQCTMLERKLKRGALKRVPYWQKDMYDSYVEGRLSKELDEATYAHGYGKLSTGEMIGAFGPNWT